MTTELFYVAFMPTIKISVPHRLGADEAKMRIIRLIAETKIKIGDKVSDVEEIWTESQGKFRFKAMGFSVSGALHVQPGMAHVEILLPFAALPFKSKIENDLAIRAKELLA
jgi:hypothetical protein